MLTIQLIDDKYCRSKWKSRYYQFGEAIEILILQSIIPSAYMDFSVTRILKTLHKRVKEVIFLSHARLPSVEAYTIDSSNKACELEGQIILSEREKQKCSCFCFSIRFFAFKKTEPVRFSEKKQRKVTLVLAVIFSAIIACSLPYNIYFVVLAFVNTPWILKLYPWLAGLVTANSLMNCFIYAGMDPSIRRYCFSLFSLFNRKSLPLPL